MALMAGCQAVLEGSLQLSGSNRFSSSNKVVTTRSSVSVRAQQQQQESSRRAVIGLVATGLVSSSFVQAVLAEAIPIKVGGPPPPSGGLRMYSFLID
jgi:photosystem II oxygen-evolving enhancer protein 3